MRLDSASTRLETASMRLESAQRRGLRQLNTDSLAQQACVTCLMPFHKVHGCLRLHALNPV